MRTIGLTERSKAVHYFEDRVAFSAGPIEVDHLRKEGRDVIFVNVRAVEDFERGHIPGAISLPKDRWDTFVGLEKGKLHVVYCYTQQCHLAPEACLTFAKSGYRVMEMEGGWQAWRAYGLEEEVERVARKAA